MKGKVAFLAITVLVLAGGAGLFFLAPVLETNQEKADRLMERETERARRLLTRFDDAELRLANIRDELAERQIDIDLPPEQLADLLGEGSKAGQNINEYMETLIAKAPYRQKWAKTFGKQPVTPTIGLNPDKQQRELTTAMKSVQQAAKENMELLDEANRIISAAMVRQFGDTSGAVHPGANRVAGMIMLRKAEAKFQETVRKRTLAAVQVNRVTRLANQVRDIRDSMPLYQDNKVTEQIAEIRQWIAKLKQQLGQETAQAQALQAKVADTRKKIDEIRARAEAARQKADAIVDDGYAITDPKSFDAFAKAYAEQAALRRTSNDEADALEFGTLKNARIDETGDLIRGQYVPEQGKEIEVAVGLASLQTTLEDTQLRADGWQKTIAVLEEQIKKLEAIQKDLAAGMNAAQAFLEARGKQLKAETEALQKLLADGAGIEEDALARASQAAGRFATAMTQADRRHRSRRWVSGELQAERADAYRMRGSIFAQRLRQLRQVEALYQDLETLGVSEVDAADIKTQIADATKQAFEALRQAWDNYETAHGKLDRHFAVAGNMATVQLILADVVGPQDPRSEEFRANAGKLLNAVADTEHPLAQEYANAMVALKIQRKVPTTEPADQAAPEQEAEEQAPEESTEEETEEETEQEPGTQPA